MYFDKNSNNTFDAGDILAANMLIEGTNAGQYWATFTDQNGAYTKYINSGTYSVAPSLTGYPFGTIASPAQYQGDTTELWLDDKHFAIQNVDVDDIELSIWESAIRPGFTTTYWLVYKNKGLNTKSGGISFAFDNRFSFLSASQTAQTTDSLLTWDYTNLAPGQSRWIQVNFQVPTDIALGERVYSNGFITPTAGDLVKQNNRFVTCRMVTGSYDPNDKQVFPRGDISPAFVAQGEYLEYLIRFQNTGTDTAFTVVLQDELSENLDLSSLEMIGSSHPYEVQITGQDAKWTFNNILLPDDKTDFQGSNGFVRYRVKPKASLVLGDQISNQAAIYFDFNAPIYTNTVTTTVNQDTVSPSVADVQAEDDASDVDVSRKLYMDFDEKIVKGTGNIYVYEEGQETQVIDVTSDKVVITNNLVYINTEAFTDETPVHILMDAGVFQDLTGNAFGGISDSTVWNFNAPPGYGSGVGGNNYTIDLISDLTAEGISSSQIELKWTDNADNETHYYIYRKLSSEGDSTFTKVGTVTANSTSFTDSGLKARTSYTYVITGYNADGESPASESAEATTLPPAISNNTISIAGKEERAVCVDAEVSQISGTTPQGGIGDYSYVWEQKTADDWQLIRNATEIHYQPSSLSDTTVFRRIVRSGSMSDTSNVVTFQLIEKNGLFLTDTAGTQLVENQLLYLCSGEELELFATGSAGKVSWYQNGTKINGANGELLTLKNLTGEHTFYAERENYGCTETSVEITVVGYPKLEFFTKSSQYNYAVKEINICEGDTETLEVALQASYEGYTLTCDWMKEAEDGSVSKVSSGLTLEVNQTGDYYPVLSIDGRCATEYPATTVTVHPAIAADIAVTGGRVEQDTIIACGGEEITLQAPENEAVSYTWRRNGNYISSAQTFKTSLSGTYELFATAGACELSSSIVIQAFSTEHPAADEVASSFCISDEAITLSGNLGDAGTFVGNGVNEHSFEPAAAGVGTHQIIYNYREAQRCETVADTLEITIYALPEARLSYDADTELLTAIPATANSYDWYKDGELLTTTDTASLLVTENGFYVVEVEQNGCLAASDTLEVELITDGGEEGEEPTGLEDELPAESLKLYPNPSEGNFFVELESSLRGELTIQITDNLGRVITAQTVNKDSRTFKQGFDMTTYAKGTYFIHISSAQGSQVLKWVKQ